jgi:hypothetical protein
LWIAVTLKCSTAKNTTTKLLARWLGISKRGNHKSSSSIYGLAQIVNGRKLRLSARSKTFTVAYELRKGDFMEAIQSNPLDTERFC